MAFLHSASTILLGFLVILALPVLYLLVLTAAAWIGQRHAREEAEPSLDVPSQRFTIFIPAHNEEKLLPACLESLRGQDYPPDLYTTRVIADNCTDRTAEVAREYGSVVMERQQPGIRGKGYALEWGFRQAQAGGLEPDSALIIVDADSSLSRRFLRAMAARLAGGERVIQAYYSVRGADRSWQESLRYIALAALHYLRPLARMTIGASAGLKGNGMVFAPGVLARYHWTESVTEDIELHMALALDGERVTFAPEAIVWGEMPNSLASAAAQVDRWESGRSDMARRYVPRLLSAAAASLRAQKFRQAFVLLDAACEHLVLPFTVLVGLSLLGLLASLAMLSLDSVAGRASITWLDLGLSLGIVTGLAVYLFSGLLLARAPASIYRAFAYAPVFLAWKLWRTLRAWLAPDRRGWVRTARNGE